MLKILVLLAECCFVHQCVLGAHAQQSMRTCVCVCVQEKVKLKKTGSSRTIKTCCSRQLHREGWRADGGLVHMHENIDKTCAVPPKKIKKQALEI